MSKQDDHSKKALEVIQDALGILEEHRDEVGGRVVSSDPLPNLLAQCLALQSKSAQDRPVRLLHHFACTGGTLIAKCLGLMPNVMLLSEIDPLSKIMLPQGRVPQPQFSPTDMIYAARLALRPASQEVLLSIFRGGLEALHDDLGLQGGMVILRDHAHSQFCTDEDWDARPSLHEIVQAHFPTRNLVTVRHPLDSYLSLISSGWVHFEPSNIEEYARRYLAFLDRHREMVVIRYEDFVQDPNQALQAMCEVLEIPFVRDVQNLLSVIGLSGDSGRGTNRIERRPRRAYGDEVAAQLASSVSFANLCGRLGYAVPEDVVTKA